ncbi:hypothetical protein [Vreelandella venusta]|uniref:hypothetical protein n=1 Tax=Vreelandella venusta TaxID=44935 RepID=UPI001166A6BC|nr:hypothetical protein [Halomonas venusta]GEK52347.1 hypothetical protein HVE01_30680 [Halomonas venusta]
MATPITWRNIGSTVSSGGTAALMQGAQSSFDKGIGALDKVLQGVKATQDANWDQGKINNTSKVLDALYSQATPEQLAEAQATGQFQQMMAGMGAQVDRDAVRTSLDSRGGILQERAIANQGYEDHNTRVDQRGLEAELYQRAHAGDIQGAQALAAQLQIDQAEHLGAVTGLRRDFAADKRDDARLANDTRRVGFEGQRVANDGARLNLQRREVEARIGELERERQLDALTAEFYKGSNANPDVPVAVAQRGLSAALEQAGATVPEIQERLAQLDSSRTIYESPGAADQLLYERGLAELSNGFGMARNTFYAASQNQEPGDVVANRIQEWARNDQYLGQAGRVMAGDRNTAQDITNLINNGLEYQRPDGSRVTVPVSESMVQSAIRNLAPSFGFRSNNIRELLKDEIEQGNYLDDLDSYNAFREEERTFKENYQQNINRRN